MFVSLFGCIVTHSTCICTSLDLRLFLCLSYCLSTLSLIQRLCVCLYIRVPQSLSLWMYVSVSGYIIALCKSVSLDSCFSLLFVSECVYKCPAKLSLIVRVYVPLLIRVSFFYLSLNVCINVGLNCHSLYLYMYGLSWSVFVWRFFFVCLGILLCYHSLYV